MVGAVHVVPVVVGVQLFITMPFGTIQAMKRRGAAQLAAPARRVQRADGRNGSATVAAALLKNNLLDLVTRIGYSGTCAFVISEQSAKSLRRAA
jgi:hypothetical protein